MSTQREMLPRQEEHPVKSSPDYTAFEAIRKALGMSGIDHDQWDFIGSKVMDSLKEAGVLKPDFESVIRSVEPNAQVWFSYSVGSSVIHPNDNYGPSLTKARAEEIASAIIAAASGTALLRECREGRRPWLIVDLDKYRRFNIHYEAGKEVSQ